MSKGERKTSPMRFNSKVDAKTKEHMTWIEYDQKMNEPGLIAILKQNQEVQNRIPFAPKKTLAEYMRKEAMARFKDNAKDSIQAEKKRQLRIVPFRSSLG
jgi:hypothetical protein